MRTSGDKLQKFQNRAARTIAGASYKSNSVDVLESLGSVTLERRRQKMKSILLYKILRCPLFERVTDQE
jgi:hypothetical protein